MSLTLHNLPKRSGAAKGRKRVGRGNASGSGTYSSRGLKGQRSRSGGRVGIRRRSIMAMLEKKPKVGGFKSPHAKLQVVNVVDLAAAFPSGGTIGRQQMAGKGLIDPRGEGVKVLGDLAKGSLDKKLTVTAEKFSATAKEAIEKAGGQAIIREKKAKPAPKKASPAGAKAA